MTSLKDIQLSNPRFRAKLEAHNSELEKNKKQLQLIEERNNRRDIKLKRLERLIKNKINDLEGLVSQTVDSINSLNKTNYSDDVTIVLAVIQPIKNDIIPKLTEIHSQLSKFILKVRMAITDECDPLKSSESSVSSESSSPMICSICLQKYTNIKPPTLNDIQSEAVDMPCTHVFHRCCLREWFEKSVTCPLCNTCDIRISYTSTIKPIFEDKIIEMNARLFEKFMDIRGVNDERIQSCLRVIFEGLCSLGAPKVSLEVEYEANIPEDTIELIIDGYRVGGMSDSEIVENLVNYYHVPQDIAQTLVNFTADQLRGI